MRELNSIYLLLIFLNLCVGFPRLQFDGGGRARTDKCETLNCNPETRVKRNIIGNSEFNYLTKFGYLPQSILETGALTTDDQLRSAIRNLQAFGGLEQTGAVDAPTRNLMSRKRCGVQDVSLGFTNRRKRYSLQGQRWHTTNLTWSLLRMEYMNELSRQDIIEELNKALKVWSSNTQLRFNFLERSELADIQVSFHRGYHGDGYPFDGIGAVLAHAFFPGPGRGGDAHFDEDENWTNQGRSDGEVTSLYAVALHEFGHSLGLSHSSVSGSVMYPWYASTSHMLYLPEDDREAIQQLYGSPRPGTIPEKDDRRTTISIPEITLAPLTPVRPTPSPDKSVPVKCETSFDAVAVIRSEMWAFKGRYFWRINKEGGTREDPVEIGSFWYGLPSSIDHVDAVYEKQNHDIVFFVGKKFYIMSGNSQLKHGPQPLTRLGLPESLEKVDGAMKWGYNQKTYFFSGDMYWRFDDDENMVELDYPRDISMWKGVPYHIDAVFQYTDKKTYFFKNRSFWEFDDIRMEVVTRTPTPVGEHWFHCPKHLYDPVTGSKSKLSSQIFIFIFLFSWIVLL